MFNLQTAMRLEELLVAGGNEFALTVGALTTATGGTTTFAVCNWTVKVTALTLEGKLRNYTSQYAPVAGKAAGESLPASATIVVGAGGVAYLDVKWAVVPGAVAYKVYASKAVGDAVNVAVCDPATMLQYKDGTAFVPRSEEHTSELQSPTNLV